MMKISFRNISECYMTKVVAIIHQAECLFALYLTYFLSPAPPYGPS